MTRNRKVDPEVLEREYIFDSANPPVSLTALAERHNLARSGVADKAMRGRWYERREEFRKQLGIKATEALSEQWVRFETATREKLMALGLSYLEKYEAALKDGEIRPSTRDMLGIASMMRALIGDAIVAKTNGEEVMLHDPDSADLHPDVARRVLDALDAGEPRSLAAVASAGASEPRED